MTREERIKIAEDIMFKHYHPGAGWRPQAVAVVDALFPRKLKEVTWPCEGIRNNYRNVSFFDGAYTLTCGPNTYSYVTVAKLLRNWECPEDSVVKALLALRDNPWEE